MKTKYSRPWTSKYEDELIQSVDKKVCENPNDIQALIEKGFLYGVQPSLDPNAAKEILKRAIELAPTNTEAYFWLAKTYYFMGDHESAEEILKEALEIDQTKADCHFMLAELKDNFEESNFHLRKAIELEPTWIWPRINLVYRLLKKGKFYEAEHVFKEAQKVFKSSKFLKPLFYIEDYYNRCITGKTAFQQADLDSLFAKLKEAQSKHQKK